MCTTSARCSSRLSGRGSDSKIGLQSGPKRAHHPDSHTEEYTMFGSLGFTELILILVIVLIIFGAGKLPQLGEGIGKAIKGFKKSVHEAEAIEAEAQTQAAQQQMAATPQQAIPAAPPPAAPAVEQHAATAQPASRG